MLAILIEENSEGFTEHQLLTLLQQPPHEFFAADSFREPLILFQSHFLLFHCLYLLQNNWRKDQHADLEISALRIKKQPLEAAVKTTQNEYNMILGDPLAQYYLDWSHFSATSGEDIEQLLKAFWKKMIVPHQHDDLQQALAILELDKPIPIDQLKVQYRHLAQRYHPDKGGDSEHFKKICQAFHQLKQNLMNSNRND